jgi:hypothetical protein
VFGSTCDEVGRNDLNDAIWGIRSFFAKTDDALRKESFLHLFTSDGAARIASAHFDDANGLLNCMEVM